MNFLTAVSRQMTRFTALIIVLASIVAFYRTRYLFMGERRHSSRRTRHHHARYGHDFGQRRLSNFG